MLLGKFPARFGAEDGEQRGQGISVQAFGVQHGDAGQRVRNGCAGARIEGVRIAAPLPLVAVVEAARGGDGAVAQGDGAGRGIGGRADSSRYRGDGHAPGLAVGALAAAAQFAADFDQGVAQAQGVQAQQHGIHGVALGDAA